MDKRMIMPLSVYVLYHKDYEEGNEIYSIIYHLLCRNPERPLTDGIDIPVFLRTGGNEQTIPQINFDQSLRNVILLLVDQHMYNCTKWKDYVQHIININNANIKIFPIALFKYSYDFNAKLGRTQFITLKTYSIKDNWTEFQTRIFDGLIRFITGKGANKLKLFISHSKKDPDNIGEQKATELKAFLRSDTKLDSFFDANDILDGYDFEEQIIENVKNSLLIILKTNTYSEREWCRIEALAGKRNKVPGIAVSLISGSVKRNFPYLGNTPLIRFNNNWNDIINLLLRTALDQYYQEQLLDEIKNYMGMDNYYILPFAPELLSFCLIKKEKKILYPEPPLGREEIVFLKEFNDEISFITPMQAYSELSKNLKGKNVAISISESEDILEYGGDETLLRDLAIELSRHILVAGGKLVYGGDLRKKGFTEKFKDLSYQYGQLEKTDRNTKYFTNYFAWPIYLNLTTHDETEFEHSRVSIMKVDAPDECLPEDKIKFISSTSQENSFLCAKSLTKMREQMGIQVNARIILGGKTSRFIGKYAGIIEEFIISRRNAHPLYLLGGFGGAAKVIVDILEGAASESELYNLAISDSSYVDFYKYYNEKEMNSPIDYESIFKEISSRGISGLNNGLSEDENIILFHSTNVLEIVALVLKGLNNKFK
ncbi:MAG: hypothetical protein BGO34_18770 [Bacteroidia bacterium 44-10]|nr:MAG: hypothetical protein BGO34_18770 [Bacteroidia bacterium 44-10]